jgi:hypothetical protein
MTKLGLTCVLLLAACGGSSAPTTTPSTPKEEPAKVVVLPDVPFEKLDHEQRIEFMKQKVVPVMKPIFQSHDATKYAEFSCVTCHGKQALEGHFDMPSTETPKLNFKDMSKWKPADLEWMGKVVKPTMAKLLGEAEYTPENPTGFGCLNCHTAE